MTDPTEPQPPDERLIGMDPGYDVFGLPDDEVRITGREAHPTSQLVPDNYRPPAPHQVDVLIRCNRDFIESMGEGTWSKPMQVLIERSNASPTGWEMTLRDVRWER